MRISVVLPVLDEAACVVVALDALQPMRAQGHEVIVVDGGSTDATVALAGPLADRVVSAPRGRAAQLIAGAAQASCEAYLFLHADTRLPTDAAEMIETALRTRDWGRFDVRIESNHPLLVLVGGMMNLRSRLTGIATGDQAMFVTRAAYQRAGGFPMIALMEDLSLSARLKAHGPPACLRAKVVTSGRRWERHGVLSTIALMWRLRLMYFLGADPQRLARLYARN